MRPRTSRGPVLSLLALLAAFVAAGSTGPAAAQSSDPLSAVVGVRATVPANARTAQSLGTERRGSGVILEEDGLVLTIGYLIMESDSTELLLEGDRRVPADVVAYDYDSGFGLLRPLAKLGREGVALGASGDLAEKSKVLVASFDEAGPDVTPAVVVSRREFAGYWEYLLPEAIFTTPPHETFGGAALFGPDGRLLGIGSLIVGDAAGPELPLPGNMFVPIDDLKPIYRDLVERGRAGGPTRPWLGLYGEEHRGRVFVTRVAPGGPAEKAGIAEDDVVLEVDGQPVNGLADLYKKVWALGEAGTAVPLTLLQGSSQAVIEVPSGDRYDYLKLKPTY